MNESFDWEVQLRSVAVGAAVGFLGRWALPVEVAVAAGALVGALYDWGAYWVKSRLTAQEAGS